MIPVEALSAMIASWASSEAIVAKVYLFGSRARGNARYDSDLDIAIELIPRACDPSPFDTWIAEAARLRTSISSCIPITVDLQWYGGPIDTPIIHAGLAAGSSIIFDRKAQPNAAGDSSQALFP